MPYVVNPTSTEMYLATITMRYFLRLIVRADKGGTWFVEPDSLASKMPAYDKDGNVITDGENPPSSTALGTYVHGEKRNWFWKDHGNDGDLKLAQTYGKPCQS
jgi:hypothetical protein